MCWASFLGHKLFDRFRGQRGQFSATGLACAFGNRYLSDAARKNVLGGCLCFVLGFVKNFPVLFDGGYDIKSVDKNDPGKSCIHFPAA